MRALHISKQITTRDTTSLDKYLNEVSKISLITAEEEVELAIRIKKGDTLALEELTKANLRFVVSVAKQYQNHGLSLSDLINEGNLGLVKAAEKFDETRGFKFISYAVWWIRQAVVQALAENSRIVRLPLNKINILNKIKKTSVYFEQTHNRKPTLDEIAECIDISFEEASLCIQNSGRNSSLDAPLSDDSDLSLLDTMNSEHYPTPEAQLMHSSLQKDLDMVFCSLSPREAEILRLFYGIGQESTMTMQEIGDHLEISRERVRQIKDNALKSIKRSRRSNILLKYLG